MTTVTVPSLILALYENEMRKIVKEVIVAVSEEFQLELDKVTLAVERRLDFNLKPVPDARGEKVKVKKKEKVVIEDTREQCLARVKKMGMFCQCTRQASTNDDEFCKGHILHQRRKWGRIDEAEPIVEVKTREKKTGRS